MTAKDCGDHHDHRHHLYRLIAYAIITLIVLTAILVFLVWAILHPSKPQFVLQDVSVYTLNISSSPTNILTTVMQLTISSHNPNDRIGIYYPKMDIYASYRGQQVTVPTLLPSTYQGHNDVNVWSPFLYGNSVPIAPNLVEALSEDGNVGAVLFEIKVDGLLKWKVGTWISGKYHFNVNCPAFIRFRYPYSGVALKYQVVQSCHMEI